VESDPGDGEALSAFASALRADDDLSRALRDDLEGATVRWASRPRGVERARLGFVPLGLILLAVGMATVVHGVDVDAMRGANLPGRGLVIFTGLFCLFSATACLLVPVAVRLRARRTWYLLFDGSLLVFDPRPLRLPRVHHFGPPLISDVRAENVEADGVGRVVLYVRRGALDVPMVPHLARVPGAIAVARRIHAALVREE